MYQPVTVPRRGFFRKIAVRMPERITKKPASMGCVGSRDTPSSTTAQGPVYSMP